MKIKRDIFNLPFDAMKTVDECIEIATVDANGEEEVASGWITCMDEIFEGVHEAMLGGEIVCFKGFELVGLNIVALCQKGGKSIRATIDSLDFINLTKSQLLWLKACSQWQDSF